MKYRLLSVIFGSLAIALAVAISASPESAGDWIGAGYAMCGVVLAGSLLVFLSRFDRGRSDALLRLDWFMPAIRRLKPGQTASHSLPGRLLRRLVPSAMQSDRSTKRRGWIRRMLRRPGLSLLASPVRRVVQTVCLLTFLVLFFYVCWPYGARPSALGTGATDWSFDQIEPTSGEFLLSGGEWGDLDKSDAQTVYVLDQSSGEAPGETVGEFRIVSSIDSSVGLEPTGEISDEMVDAFFTSTGPWAFYDRDPNAWPSHYTDHLARKEVIPAETFLVIDPLVSFSTAVASRSWVWSIVSAAIILIVCVLIPRGFCGYLCPLGTTIDLFDWAIAGRVKRFRVPDEGWWVHIKYYLLSGTLICAVFGVLVSGFFSAIPVITRAMLFLVEPLQTGTLRGWHLIPSMNVGHFLSLGLFFAVLSLGFLRPRFWCKYVCPSGAVFSVGNLFRATERKVESSCINCNKCVEICPFDAIKPDFTTRVTDCTMCQSCGGVCPTHAIKFVERWNVVELKVENDPPTHETAIGRRGFLSLASGTAAAVTGGVAFAGASKTFGANLEDPNSFRPVRPPGSVPEREFLDMCIRCGECFKVCPNNVLQSEGFEQGLEGLWTPMVKADWAGCESSCNACGQVCPTGAIRALPLEEKKVARMGLAIVNQATCLPFAEREACDLCVQECNAAGYEAIEYTQVGTKVDENGQPIEGTGYRAPVVLADKCVGCGLCQTRCYGINVKEKGLLRESAIIIEAGEGKEDRLMGGSYRELRQNESTKTQDAGPKVEYYIPGEDVPGGDLPGGETSDVEVPDAEMPTTGESTDSDPFGVSGEQSEPVVDDDPFGLK